MAVENGLGCIELHVSNTTKSIIPGIPCLDFSVVEILSWAGYEEGYWKMRMVLKRGES